MEHITVLRKETIDLLQPENKKVYVDMTLGAGGHSLEILSRAKGIKLICFDIDKKNIEAFQKILKEQKLDKDNEIHLFNRNFALLDSSLEEIGINGVDGIVADLGWSSDQLGEVAGLSYEKKDDILDMRMNPEYGVRAADLLNGLGKRELSEMFEKYSDIYGASNNRLVDEIRKFRNRRLFETVGDFINAINNAFGIDDFEKSKKGNKFQLYSKAFQALRIAVNNEFSNLNDALMKGFKSLNQDGVMSILTFHSGEEKVLSSFINKLDGDAEIVSRAQGNNFIRPTVEELVENLRARSAKLFGIKKK